MERSMTQGPDATPLVTLLKSAGYPRREAPLLYPAELFVELSGEDLRRRLYLTQDADGGELCLRPEFTIPLCKALIPELGEHGKAAVSYFGPVFRHRSGESGEFTQAGVESLGRTDTEAADADILSLALLSARMMGERRPAVRMGDAALLDAALAAIKAPAAFARRLKRRLAAGRSPAEAVAASSATEGVERFSGVLAAIGGSDPAAARAFVGDMLKMTGVSAVGGRSVDEIAGRFLARTREGEGEVSTAHQQFLSEFLSLTGTPDDVLFQAERLTKAAEIDIAATLASFERRTGFMAAGEIELDRIAVSPGFARNLDYYTGVVFEIIEAGSTAGKPLIGGGRYDGLMRRLGAARDIPAIGFAIWIERFGRGA
jgi:ATP phosphoribosyltransferase regulatory subunit